MPECVVLGQKLTSLAEALGTALLGGAFDTSLPAFPLSAAGGLAPLLALCIAFLRMPCICMTMAPLAPRPVITMAGSSAVA